jgi:hypothetical protein
MARLLLAPEAGFALAVLTNHSPDGNALMRDVTLAALRLYLGLDASDPEPIKLPGERLPEYARTYANQWAEIELRVEDGRLVDHTTPKGGFPTKDTPPFPAPPPAGLAFYDEDRVVVTEGPFRGSYGDFVRDADGEIAWYRSGGRLYAAQG